MFLRKDPAQTLRDFPFRAIAIKEVSFNSSKNSEQKLAFFITYSFSNCYIQNSLLQNNRDEYTKVLSLSFLVLFSNCNAKLFPVNLTT